MCYIILTPPIVKQNNICSQCCIKDFIKSKVNNSKFDINVAIIEYQ